MKKKEDLSSKRVTLNITPSQYEALRKKYHKTTCRSLNNYLQKLVLGKSPTLIYYDKALDALTNEVIKSNKILNELLGRQTKDERYQQALIQEIYSLKQLLTKFSEYVCTIGFRHQCHEGDSLP